MLIQSISYMCILYVYLTCVCCMQMINYMQMSMLHVYVVCVCYMQILHVDVYSLHLFSKVPKCRSIFQHLSFEGCLMTWTQEELSCFFGLMKQCLCKHHPKQVQSAPELDVGTSFHPSIHPLLNLHSGEVHRCSSFCVLLVAQWACKQGYHALHSQIFLGVRLKQNIGWSKTKMM